MTDTSMTAVSAAVNKPPIVILRERLENRRDEIEKALPTDIKPDRFIRALVTSATINPDLQACTWQSIWNACMRACRDGLLPDGVEGAIVAYGSKAQWIPMYQGLLRRAYDSGQYLDVCTDVVREGDHFRSWTDENGAHLIHEVGDEDGPIVKVFALARTKSGGKFIRVMNMAEAQKHENVSRAKREDAPWKIWREAMLKKTVLRQLCKLLPAGRDIDREDDDIPEIEAPTSAPIAPVARREAGAASALEQFASSQTAPLHNTGDVQPPDGEDGGEQDSGRDTPGPDLAAADLVEAYRRGTADRAAGRSKRALPGEYRDDTRLALAWQAGFDGSPMPNPPELAL